MTKGVQTGMQGVYLVAAELASRGLIVSVTSRSAEGADLLVTNRHCRNAWSVQVKTNHQAASCWLTGKNALEITSQTHIYVFVNLRGDKHPDYYVVPSQFVATHICVDPRKNGTFYSFGRNDAMPYLNGWDAVFGLPSSEEIEQSTDN